VRNAIILAVFYKIRHMLPITVWGKNW